MAQRSVLDFFGSRAKVAQSSKRCSKGTPERELPRKGKQPPFATTKSQRKRLREAPATSGNLLSAFGFAATKKRGVNTDTPTAENKPQEHVQRKGTPAEEGTHQQDDPLNSIFAGKCDSTPPQSETKAEECNSNQVELTGLNSESTSNIIRSCEGQSTKLDKFVTRELVQTNNIPMDEQHNKMSEPASSVSSSAKKKVESDAGIDVIDDKEAYEESDDDDEGQAESSNVEEAPNMSEDDDEEEVNYGQETGPSAYERLRQERVARNAAFLRGLGLGEARAALGLAAAATGAGAGAAAKKKRPAAGGKPQARDPGAAAAAAPAARMMPLRRSRRARGHRAPGSLNEDALFEAAPTAAPGGAEGDAGEEEEEEEIDYDDSSVLKYACRGAAPPMSGGGGGGGGPGAAAAGTAAAAAAGARPRGLRAAGRPLAAGALAAVYSLAAAPPVVRRQISDVNQMVSGERSIWTNREAICLHKTEKAVLGEKCFLSHVCASCFVVPKYQTQSDLVLLLAAGTSTSSNEYLKNSWCQIAEEAFVEGKRAHRKWVSGVYFPCAAKNPTGTLLYSSADDGLIKLWDISKQHKGMPKLVYTADHIHGKGIFSMDGKGSYLVTGSKDKSVNVSSIGEDGQLDSVARFFDHSKVVKCVAVCSHEEEEGSSGFSPYSLVASGGDDGRAAVRDWRAPPAAAAAALLEGAHDRAVHSVAWGGAAGAGAGRVLATAGLDPWVRAWDLRRTDAPLHAFRGHASSAVKRFRAIHHPVFHSKFKDFLITGGEGSNKISVYDLKTGTTVSRGNLEADTTCIATGISVTVGSHEKNSETMNRKKDLVAVALSTGELMFLETVHE